MFEQEKRQPEKETDAEDSRDGTARVTKRHVRSFRLGLSRLRGAEAQLLRTSGDVRSEPQPRTENCYIARPDAESFRRCVADEDTRWHSECVL